jgi:hypothetical protein
MRVPGKHRTKENTEKGEGRSLVGSIIRLLFIAPGPEFVQALGDIPVPEVERGDG